MMLTLGPSYGLFLLILRFLTTRGGTINTGPTSITTSVGSTPLLNCDSTIVAGDLIFEWSRAHYAVSQQKLYTRVISSGAELTPYPNEFSIENNFNLRFLSAKRTDGGLYKCDITGSNGAAAEAQVVVVETPQLSTGNSYRELENVTIECVVQFGGVQINIMGSLKPSVSASVNGRSLPGDIVETTNKPTTPENDYMEYTITAKFNYTAYADDNNENITCLASTQDNFRSETSKLLNIQFSPRDVRVEGLRSQMVVGDIINCTAQANDASGSQATIEWRAITTPASTTQISGAQLELTQAMVGTNQWDCRATNSLGIANATTPIFAVVVPKGSSPQTAQPVAIALGTVGGLLFVAIVVFLIIFFIMRKRRRERDSGYGESIESSRAAKAPTNEKRAPHKADYLADSGVDLEDAAPQKPANQQPPNYPPSKNVYDYDYPEPVSKPPLDNRAFTGSGQIGPADAGPLPSDEKYPSNTAAPPMRGMHSVEDLRGDGAVDESPGFARMSRRPPAQDQRYDNVMSEMKRSPRQTQRRPVYNNEALETAT